MPPPGNVKQQTIDLVPHAGQRVRIWLNKDKTCSVDPAKDHFWQVAEFDVPNVQYPLALESKDNPDQTPDPVLDLTGMKIIKWDLPI